MATDRNPRTRKPRCFFLYALAPDTLSAADANRHFNTFIADRNLPQVLFHDHFIGQAGGIGLFYVQTARERDVLYEAAGLAGWDVMVHPLIFSRSPAAFDEQIAFTLRAYRGLAWEEIRKESRPTYGDPAREAQTARQEE